MKFVLILSLIFNAKAFAWGATGHKVVAEIASRQLTPKAQSETKKILEDETFPQVATWADLIRQQKRRPYAAWHVVNIPEGKTYKDSEKNVNGDIIVGLETLEKKLRDKNLSKEERNEALKLFIHFMGDIHMPLHSGYKDDLGGNKIKISWRNNNISLHKLWDEILIDEQKLSYIEMANSLKNPQKEQIQEWAKASYIEITNESRDSLKKIYQLNTKENLWEQHYTEQHKDFLNMRLLQAGIRLAEKLNDIFKDY